MSSQLAFIFQIVTWEMCVPVSPTSHAPICSHRATCGFKKSWEMSLTGWI